MTISTLTMLLLTGVIAASTVIYTFYSIRLWKATRLSADISRYTLFLNFIFELDRQVQLAKVAQRPDALFLEQFEKVMVEQGLQSILRGVDLRENAELAELLARLDGMLRTSNLNPADVSWLNSLLQKGIKGR